MPGPVSDSYDPEFGTAANANDVREAIQEMYKRVSKILGGKPPLCILDIVHAEGMTLQLLNKTVTANPPLTEKQWRLIRFALERATESI